MGVKFVVKNLLACKEERIGYRYDIKEYVDGKAVDIISLDVLESNAKAFEQLLGNTGVRKGIVRQGNIDSNGMFYTSANVGVDDGVLEVESLKMAKDLLTKYVFGNLANRKFVNHNGNKPSMFENAFEYEVIAMCKHMGAEIADFIKVGHAEEYDNVQLKYNLAVKCNREVAEELSRVLGSHYIDYNETFDARDVKGIHTLSWFFFYPARKYAKGEETIKRFDEFIKDCNKIVTAVEKVYGITVEGVPNAEKFNDVIEDGLLGMYEEAK